MLGQGGVRADSRGQSCMNGAQTWELRFLCLAAIVGCVLLALATLNWLAFGTFIGVPVIG
jgi:hypothetical protein